MNTARKISPKKQWNSSKISVSEEEKTLWEERFVEIWVFFVKNLLHSSFSVDDNKNMNVKEEAKEAAKNDDQKYN